MTAQPPFVLQGYTPPAPAAPALNINDIMAQYRDLRARRDELKQLHAAQLAPITEEMDRIEAELLKAMVLTGLSQFSSGDTTAFKQTRVRARISDPHEFRKWCEANNRYDFYENRISKDVLDNWIEQGNDLPAGVEVTSDVVVNIRKK